MNAQTDEVIPECPECPGCCTKESVESLGIGIAGPEFYCTQCFTNWTQEAIEVGKSINRSQG